MAGQEQIRPTRRGGRGRGRRGRRRAGERAQGTDRQRGRRPAQMRSTACWSPMPRSSSRVSCKRAGSDGCRRGQVAGLPVGRLLLLHRVRRAHAPELLPARRPLPPASHRCAARHDDRRPDLCRRPDHGRRPPGHDGQPDRQPRYGEGLCADEFSVVGIAGTLGWPSSWSSSSRSSWSITKRSRAR
jgi:hypothetical protein